MLKRTWEAISKETYLLMSRVWVLECWATSCEDYRNGMPRKPRQVISKKSVLKDRLLLALYSISHGCSYAAWRRNTTRARAWYWLQHFHPMPHGGLRRATFLPKEHSALCRTLVVILSRLPTIDLQGE